MLAAAMVAVALPWLMLAAAILAGVMGRFCRVNRSLERLVLFFSYCCQLVCWRLFPFLLIS